MRADLELARRHVERWAKHPSIIPAELARKDTPTRRELVWVYRALVWQAVLVVIGALCVADLSSDWTWHNACTATLVVVVLLWLPVAYVVFHHTFLGKPSVFSIDATKIGLNWTGRKQAVLLDRNRKRMPWHGQRLGRLKEGDGRYEQMSVWMSASGEGVQFRVLAHMPPTRFFRLIEGRVWMVRVWERGGRPAQEHVPVKDVVEDTEKLVDARERFEKLAREAEETSYGNAIASDRLRATVLNFRR